MRKISGRFGAVARITASVGVMLAATLAAPAQETAPSPGYSVIANFSPTRGSFPNSSLIADSAGNLYGTTVFGGIDGYGTVFEILATGGQTVLYNFTGLADGAYPNASLLRDSSGILYGTAEGGGIFNSTCPSGCGVIFKLGPQGKEKVLYSFTGGSDGYQPSSHLIHDAAGNLYGTAAFGGITSACVESGLSGCGVVFEVSRDGKETVLYSFTGGADGAVPDFGLIRDAAGNLYGTTTEKGDLSSCSGIGCGVAFSLDTAGNETVLYAFTGGSDGAVPSSGLTEDRAGNLYGTTDFGGDASCAQGSGGGCGVVFKLDPAGNETVLHTFTGPDGQFPVGGLVLNASSGALYGVTTEGGAHGLGCIFGLNPAGTETVIHSFDGTDGADPVEEGGLLVYDGALYGTTLEGGSSGEGVAFKLQP